MSFSSSRRSSKMREDGEFYLECKAAFLTEYDDISDKIESRNKLVSCKIISLYYTYRILDFSFSTTFSKAFWMKIVEQQQQKFYF